MPPRRPTIRAFYEILFTDMAMSNSNPEKQRFTTYFTGQVQGVGFRYTTESIARSFAVTGYVRNLPDGRVEMVAEAQPDEHERFLAQILTTMKANIEVIQTDSSVATSEYASFSINH